MTVQVHAFNEASIRLNEGLGFQQEGRLRRVVFTRGRHFDSLVFGLTAEEFDGLDGTGECPAAESNAT